MYSIIDVRIYGLSSTILTAAKLKIIHSKCQVKPDRYYFFPCQSEFNDLSIDKKMITMEEFYQQVNDWMWQLVQKRPNVIFAILHCVGSPHMLLNYCNDQVKEKIVSYACVKFIPKINLLSFSHLKHADVILCNGKFTKNGLQRSKEITVQTKFNWRTAFMFIQETCGPPSEMWIINPTEGLATATKVSTLEQTTTTEGLPIYPIKSATAGIYIIDRLLRLLYQCRVRRFYSMVRLLAAGNIPPELADYLRTAVHMSGCRVQGYVALGQDLKIYYQFLTSMLELYPNDPWYTQELKDMKMNQTMQLQTFFYTAPESLFIFEYKKWYLDDIVVVDPEQCGRMMIGVVKDVWETGLDVKLSTNAVVFVPTEYVIEHLDMEMSAFAREAFQRLSVGKQHSMPWTDKNLYGLKNVLKTQTAPSNLFPYRTNPFLLFTPDDNKNNQEFIKQQLFPNLLITRTFTSQEKASLQGAFQDFLTLHGESPCVVCECPAKFTKGGFCQHHKHFTCQDCIVSRILSNVYPGEVVHQNIALCAEADCWSPYNSEYFYSILPFTRHRNDQLQIFLSNPINPTQTYVMCRVKNCNLIFPSGPKECSSSSSSRKDCCDNHSVSATFSCPNCGRAYQHLSGCEQMICCIHGYHGCKNQVHEHGEDFHGTCDKEDHADCWHGCGHLWVLPEEELRKGKLDELEYEAPRCT